MFYEQRSTALFVVLTEMDGGAVVIAARAITCIRQFTRDGVDGSRVDYSAGSTVEVQEPPEVILAKLKQPNCLPG